jgi:5'-nucleotidase/UDP-sugar diphosphatase
MADAKSKGAFLHILLLLLLLVFLGLAWGGGPCFAGDPGNDVHRLVVLHTNDTHGHPLKFSYHGKPDVGGLPARTTLIKRIRQENDNVLVLDAGDLNTGRPESTLFKAEPDILGYNHIGYDAMVLGNHEFDNPLEVLKWQMELAQFPVLSANVMTEKGRHLATPYIIRSFEGFKVAIFGLTLAGTPSLVDPDIIRDLVFEDEVEVAQRLVPVLRQEADIVIALVHLGIYRSEKRGSKRLASEVSGIDLIVDGHTHTRLDSPIIVKNRHSGHKSLIVQAWQWGLAIGRTDLEIRNGKVIDHHFELLPVNLKAQAQTANGDEIYRYVDEKIEEDKDLLELLRPYGERIEARLSKIIGHAEGTFRHRDRLKGETALGDLVADAMLWHTRRLSTDFAVQNTGGIRTGLMKGPITKGMVYEMLPFEDTVVVLTLKEPEARALFNHIGNVSSASGAFPQVSEGLSFTVDRDTKRCRKILINGVPFNPQRTYKIVTNSYLAHGGDGYRMFLKAIDTYDTSTLQTEALIAYIEHLGGRIRPVRKGRITSGLR